MCGFVGAKVKKKQLFMLFRMRFYSCLTKEGTRTSFTHGEGVEVQSSLG